MIISKIEALKRDEVTVYDIGHNDGISDVLEMPEIQAVDELIEKVQAWWDKCYPEYLFNGSSGDEGALDVVEIRALLKKV